MDWFEKLETRKAAVVFAITLIATATLATSSLRIFAGYDVFWHLQMGKDWIAEGLSPWLDHYSFTFGGSAITSPPILFQTSLYELVDVFGEYGGFFAMRLAAFILVLGSMLLWLRVIRAPALVYCLVFPLLTVLLQLRSIVRPELFSYPLIVLAIVLYHRTQDRLTWRTMLPICALMLLWTNHHSSFLAYVIFFGLFVDIAIQLIKTRAPLGDWIPWASWGIVLIGIGFLKPGFDHTLLQIYNFPVEWKNIIQEYKSPTVYYGVFSLYVLLSITTFTLIWLATQRKYGLLIVTLIFVYSGSTIVRMVTPAGILVLCLFAYALTDFNLKKWVNHPSKAVTVVAGIICLLVSLVPLFEGVQKARTFIKQNTDPFSYMPYALTEYLTSKYESGRIFNNYESGGFLIYRLPKTFKVFIDGRTWILYPLEHHLKHINLLSDRNALKNEVEMEGINFAVLDDSSDNAMLMADVGFELDFVDYQYALFTKEAGQFPNAGRLWARPYCWKPETAAALEEEWARAREILPPHVSVLLLLSTIQKFESSLNRELFFKTEAAREVITDPTRRFLAYRAIDFGLGHYAINQFNRIIRKQPKDYLASALANLHVGDVEAAEQAIDRATRNRWSNLEFTDLLIQHALLYEISQKTNLKYFDTEYMENLSRQVGKFGLPNRGETVTVDTFCTDPKTLEQAL